MTIVCWICEQVPDPVLKCFGGNSKAEWARSESLDRSLAVNLATPRGGGPWNSRASPDRHSSLPDEARSANAYRLLPGACSPGSRRPRRVGARDVRRCAREGPAGRGRGGRRRALPPRRPAPERYVLRASLLGYVPWVRRDLVLSESAPNLDLGTNALAVSPIALKPVDVSTASATAVVAPDRNIYLTKDMPSATTGTATDVLKSVPELDVDLDGHVTLRGSTRRGLRVALLLEVRVEHRAPEPVHAFAEVVPVGRRQPVQGPLRPAPGHGASRRKRSNAGRPPSNRNRTRRARAGARPEQRTTQRHSADATASERFIDPGIGVGMAAVFQSIGPFWKRSIRCGSTIAPHALSK